MLEDIAELFGEVFAFSGFGSVENCAADSTGQRSTHQLGREFHRSIVVVEVKKYIKKRKRY